MYSYSDTYDRAGAAERPIGRAAVLARFGAPEQMVIRPVPNPTLGRHDILVQVHASSVNPIEWKMRAGLGLPHALWRLLLGRWPILGLDYSGTVIGTGKGVERFRPGDQVFGARRLSGAYTDRLVVRETSALALKPAEVSHAQAALTPFAGQIALACLRAGPLNGDLKGRRVMVIGASGGVGHLAVQMARRIFQAREVIGVCSARNAEFVSRCGAHSVVAYDQTPPEAIASSHPDWIDGVDLIVDAVGDERYHAALASMLLAPHGHYAAAALPAVSPGRPGEDARLADLPRLMTRLAGRAASGRYTMVTGLIGGLGGATDVADMARWLADGRLQPHEHAAFTLDQIADAHRLSETGRTVGKISIRMP